MKIRPDALSRPNAGPGTCAGPRRRKGGVQTRDISYRNAASRALRWLEALQQLVAPVSANAFVALDMHIGRKSRSGREWRRCVAGSSPDPWRRRDDAQLPASRRSGRSATRARRAVHQPSENHVFGACCTRAKTCASELRRSWRTASIHESPAGPKRASAGATARRRGRRDEISGLVLTRQQTGPYFIERFCRTKR